MKKMEVSSLKRKASKLREELFQLGPVMRGSVVVIGTKNKQPYFSLNKDKKTKIIYLGKKREPIANEYSANYKRLVEIVDEMTLVNMELLKRNAVESHEEEPT